MTGKKKKVLFLPIVFVCVCVKQRRGDLCFFSLTDIIIIIPENRKIWKCSGIMMCQVIRQSDSAAKLHAFIRSGLDDEPGSYQIEFKQRYLGFTRELCISEQPH